MRRSSRVLVGLYAAVALWLTYCTVVTWGTAATWSSATMAAASLVVAFGVLREVFVADDRRRSAVLLEREARRLAWRKSAAEAVAQQELGAACCERWWTSLGVDHEADCVRETPRSSAA